MLDFERKNSFANFIKVRSDFESILIEYDYLVQQIVRKYRSAMNSYEHVKKYYLLLISKLLDKAPILSVIDEVINDKEFSYLTLAKVSDNTDEISKEFSR